MTEQRCDHDLLASGSPDDFEAFYVRHLDIVIAYVRRRVARHDLTFDIVAETFARALQHRDRFRPDQGPAIAWLFTMAANLMRDAARRGRVADKTRRRLGMEPVTLDDEDLRALEGRVDEPLLQALERLPVDQREAVRRRVIDETPYPLIAQETGCSEQVVRQRVHRGLRTIRTTTKEQRA